MRPLLFIRNVTSLSFICSTGLAIITADLGSLGPLDRGAGTGPCVDGPCGEGLVEPDPFSNTSTFSISGMGLGMGLAGKGAAGRVEDSAPGDSSRKSELKI